MSGKFIHRGSVVNVPQEKLDLIHEVTSAFRKVLEMFDAHILVIGVCVHENKGSEKSVTMVSGTPDQPELYQDLIAVFEKHTNPDEKGTIQ